VLQHEGQLLASGFSGEMTKPPYMAPRNSVAVVGPLLIISDTVSPGASPSPASRAATSAAASRSAAKSSVVPSSGAIRNGACGCCRAQWSSSAGSVSAGSV